MKHFIIKNKLLNIEKMIKVNSLRYTGTVQGCLVVSWGVLWCPVASCGNQTHPTLTRIGLKDVSTRAEAIRTTVVPIRILTARLSCR